MGSTPSQLDDSAPAPSPRERPASAGNRPDLRPPTLGPRPSHGPSQSRSPMYTPPRPSESALPRASSAPISMHMPLPIPPMHDRPPVQRSAVVANVLNVRKDSVKLIRSQTHPYIYLLQFVFDAQVDGFITIYYCAQQIVHRERQSQSPDVPITKLSYVAKGDVVSGKTPFPSGEAQQYQQHADRGLDVRQYKSAELQRVDMDHYPVVIRLEAIYPPDSETPVQQRVKSQTTFATLTPKDGAYAVNVIAQQVLVNGIVYKILNLYGIGGKNVTAIKNSDSSYAVDSTDECVVCLTEPSDTACEPCNHLCLCEDCARTLWSQTDRNRRKCPICRSDLAKLLRIIPAQGSAPPSASILDSPAAGENMSQPSKAPKPCVHPQPTLPT